MKQEDTPIEFRLFQSLEPLQGYLLRIFLIFTTL